MAAALGIELLTEEQYRELQKIGNFDTKTSSWAKTPSDIRKLGGALFADRRYVKVFVYHNSAPSYYSVRGFPGLDKRLCLNFNYYFCSPLYEEDRMNNGLVYGKLQV
jgi:hypothetical protein